MNKTELINAVSDSTEIDRDTVRTVFNGIVDTIKNRLWIGVNIRIKDFMTFTLVKQREINGKNPKTGKPMLIPKHYKLKLAFSKPFKDKLKTKVCYKWLKINLNSF